MAETISPTISDKPVIGISGGGPMSESVKSMVRQMETAGATVILLANHPGRDANADIDKIDALVVMGNNADIAPEKYGAAPHPKTFSENSTPENKARGDYEDAMLAKALAQKKPVLAVCAGMQRLNVLCGGTLHQHVPDITGNDEHTQQNLGIGFSTPVQPVLIENNTTLGGIADEVRTVFAPAHSSNMPTIMMENSMHHQAVDRVGSGLRAVAYAEDEVPSADGGTKRLVEAVEIDPNGPLAGGFAIGVQWHPEFGASPLGEKLATRLVSEGRQYAQQHGTQHGMDEVARENAFSQQQNYVPASPAKDPEANRIRPGSMAAMVMMARAQATERAATPAGQVRGS